jgi:hypothetical protein
VICAFWHIHSFYLFSHFIVIYLLPVPISVAPPPNVHKLICKQTARVKCLALKMNHH